MPPAYKLRRGYHLSRVAPPGAATDPKVYVVVGFAKTDKGRVAVVESNGVKYHARLDDTFDFLYNVLGRGDTAPRH